MKKIYRRLRTFNAVMGAFHLIQGVILLLISSDFALPVTSSFLKFDIATRTLNPNLVEEFTLEIGPMIAVFLFMSAIAHFLLTMPGINKWYNQNLKRGANYMRWVEYAFSSSVMMVIISMLVGIYDGVSLLLIFFLNMGMILFGWVMELHNQSTKKTNWTSYWFGSLMGIIPWVAIAIYLLGAGGGEMGPPTFVYWIFFSIFVFFNTFAINMALQYKKIGRWKDYTYGEYMYIVLSLVAKSILAWQVYAGTLQPM